MSLPEKCHYCPEEMKNLQKWRKKHLNIKLEVFHNFETFNFINIFVFILQTLLNVNLSFDIEDNKLYTLHYTFNILYTDYAYY